MKTEKGKRGARSGNDKVMRVQLPSEHFRVLEYLAASEGITVSDVVRRQIRQLVATTEAA